jgi:hypothetical protein
MNVEKLFDRVFVYKESLDYTEKEHIVDDILDRTTNLPIKRPFTKDQLLNFVDKDLIMYLVDVYELFSIKYWTEFEQKL